MTARTEFRALMHKEKNMSVICDTTKIRAYIDKSVGTWNVLIRKLKNKNGKTVKFCISHDTTLTEEEVYTMFFEKLEKGEFRQNVRTGGGILKQKDNGSYYLEYPVDVTAPLNVTKRELKAPKAPIIPSITYKGNTLFDPHTPESKALVGKKVLGSTTFVFSEGKTFRGILESTNGGFHVRVGDEVIVCPFIREIKPEPFNLNNSEVRRALLGKIIMAKDGTHELLLCNAVKKDGIWRLNGLSASALMNDYTFTDGSELVASF